MRSSKKALKDLAENELIGLECEVVNSSQRSLVGMKGKIVDETLNTLLLDTQNGEKKIQKKSVVLEIKFPRKNVVIKGKDLMQRPHERLRKLWRKIR